MSASIHLKGLNGIRAIAAMGVVVSHIGLALKSFGFGFQYSTDLAGFGVTMFFSLSGFLITYLLLVEKKRFNRIDIKAFYIRRVLRIWPLYFFYLFLAILTMLLFIPKELNGGIIYYFVLCANIPSIFGFPFPFLTHYWSLGVEEQFYLFWPWIVRKSVNIVRFLVIFICTFIVVKIGLRYLAIKSSYEWPYEFIHVTRFDCMAIGALGAVFSLQNNSTFYKITQSILVQLLAWASIVLVAINKFHISSVIDSEIIAVMTVILIVNVSANAKTIINLEIRPLDFLGKISYGIYVYHPLIIFLTSKWIGTLINGSNDTIKLVLIYSVVIIESILVAYISYEIFEKRFLSLKKKFSSVKNTDSLKPEIAEYVPASSHPGAR